MTAEQLTLAGLLDELAKVPQDAIVKLAGFGSGSTPGVLFRHRPFVDGLAITPTMVRADLESTVAEYSEFLRQSGPGLTCRNPRRAAFIDPHPGNMDSPVWVSLQYEIGFHAVTEVVMIRGFAVIRTINMAPVQGPTIQRIPDEEAARRMRETEGQSRPGATPLPSKAEKWLINMAARDRTTVRLDLEEARADLANFAASLQAKRDKVAKLESAAARHDYVLGIRNELPAPAKEF